MRSDSTFPIPADSRRSSSSRSPRARPADRASGRATSGTLDAGDAASIHTGLTPRVAASLAYLAGPLSGALLLAIEPASRFVRFHAWQAVFALGLLGIAAVVFLGLAFVLLVVSPTAFWTMLWLAAATGAAWIGVWGLCVVSAYKGRALKLPLAGTMPSGTPRAKLRRSRPGLRQELHAELRPQRSRRELLRRKALGVDNGATYQPSRARSAVTCAAWCRPCHA